MHTQWHALFRLSVHLPMNQNVYFRQGQQDGALERAVEKDTHLTAWFKLNQNNVDAGQYLSW